MNQNALLAASDDASALASEVSRLIVRYGLEAVRQSALNQTKPKRGRKHEVDWPELSGFINAEAQEWLGGGNPLEARTNYKIAKGFANKNPGKMPSQHTRALGGETPPFQLPTRLDKTHNIIRCSITISANAHYKSNRAINAQKESKK